MTPSSDTKGILEIELLPRPAWADITKRLAHTMSRAHTMRAAVAYWTIGPDDVSFLLAPLLSKPDSFLCVDIHFPTNLDQLNRLNARGVQLYLHLRHLSTNTELDTNKRLPQHLMHTKLLLFDFSDGTAEIWVGSHNWTARALSGPNIEESIVLRVHSGSPLYNDVVESLTYIRDLCTRFKPDDLSKYKRLQDHEIDTGAMSVPVIALEGNQVEDLRGAISLFGSITSDWEDLHKIKDQVFLEVTDLKKKRSSIYSAKILHSGLQPAANQKAGGLAFSKRRYAVIDGKQRPVLEAAAKPSNALLESSEYFVTLERRELLSRTVILKPSLPKQASWVRVRHDPLLKRVLAEPHDERWIVELPEPNKLQVRLRKLLFDMKVPAYLEDEHEGTQEELFSEDEQNQQKLQRFPLIIYKLLENTRPESLE